jgi:hypothetical protein
MWNRVAALPHDDVLAAAMMDNVALAQSSNQAWSSGFSAFLSTIGALPQHGLEVDGQLVRLDPENLLTCLDTWLHQGWQGLPGNPRAADSQQVTFSTYQAWFAADSVEEGLQDDRWKYVPAYVRFSGRIQCMCRPDRA